ncbi:RNA polymerase sigma-70 factor, ECF subfamily [bacterium A37T11]|nr:RNA polymerase sigma-70 factor, ECF subfamily [bacterium A37T11]
MKKIDNQSEKQQLELLKQGDHGAFEYIYKNYYEFLYIYAYKLTGDHSESEDLVQNLFSELWQKHAEMDIRTSLLPYLYRSLRHDFLDLQRANTTRTGYYEDFVTFSNAYQQGPDAYLAEKEIIAKLEQLAESLPGKMGQVFLLVNLNGHSPAEIAALLNLSERTIDNLLSKATQSMKLKLGLAIALFISSILTA